MFDASKVKFQEIAVIGHFSPIYYQIKLAWAVGPTSSLIGAILDLKPVCHPSPLFMTLERAFIQYVGVEYRWAEDYKYLLVRGRLPECFTLYKVIDEEEHFKC